MIKEEQKIVTKRRYSGLKALIMVALFSVELFVLFVHFFMDRADAIYALFAYALLSFSFLGKMSSSKVYLKYEFSVSVLIKSTLLNGITWLIMMALQPGESALIIFLKMILLTILNFVTILGVDILINMYVRRNSDKAKGIFHVYPDNFTKSGKSMEEVLDQVKKDIDEYEYVYLHNLSSRARKRLLKYCYEHNKVVYCTANLSDVILRAAGVTQDIDSPVYFCTSFGISGISAVIKRAFDIVFSVVMLLLTWPIMLVTTVCIKLEDRGSILYKQIRCTKDMKEFTIYKFRSMIEDSEGGEARLAVSDDKRLTKVGKIIRRYKIDELPQLINILKGDMSVVGPRPERPEMVKRAIVTTPEFILRTKVKAGLTGYAQIRGYYNTGFKDKLLWDLIYIETFSIILDIKIILMTIIAVFSENIRDD